MRERTISWVPYLTVITLFAVLLFGFDFNGLYGQDAHEYLRYSKALSLQFETGAHPEGFYWPKLYPFLGSLGSLIKLPAVLSLQLISLFSLLGAMYFLQRSLQLLYNSSGTWFLLLAAATQVYFVRSGLFVMSDALATFWVMGFVFFYLKYKDESSFKHFMLLAGFAIAAIFTRYAVLPLFAIPMLHVVWLLFSKYGRIARLIMGLGILLGLMCVLLNNNQALELIFRMFDVWDIRHLFQRNFVYDAYPQSYWVPNGLYMLSNFAHIGYLSFGALLLIWWQKWSFKERFLWLGVMVYLVFLGGIGFQNQRFMVISHLWVLLLVYPAFQSLKLWLTQRKLWWLFVVAVILFNSAFFYYSFSKLFAVHRLEKEISAAIDKLDSDDTIYAFYITPALKSYGISNPTVDLWSKDIAFTSGSYAVFNLEEFRSNKRVMGNWNRLNRNFELKEINELPKNWKIYRIE